MRSFLSRLANRLSLRSTPSVLGIVELKVFSLFCFSLTTLLVFTVARRPGPTPPASRATPAAPVAVVESGAPVDPDVGRISHPQPCCRPKIRVKRVAQRCPPTALASVSELAPVGASTASVVGDRVFGRLASGRLGQDHPVSALSQTGGYSYADCPRPDVVV